MSVYIAGAQNEVEWAEAVDRLIAEGFIAGPEDARGLTADEFLGADADAIRLDVEDVLDADMVVLAGPGAWVAETVAAGLGHPVLRP